MDNSDERRSQRANVILTATVESGGVHTPVRIGNLSAHGAMIIADRLPPLEALVTFHCNGIAVQAWVAWIDAGRAGIQFADPIDPDMLTKRPAIRQPTIVKDRRDVDFRRPGFRGNQMTEEERKIVEEWNRPEPEPPDDEGPSKPGL